jgi:3-dehydroquinate dehydratase-2
MKRVLVLHGPNLNLLGSREPDHYGHATLEQIDRRLAELGQKAGVVVASFQSNAEAPLIDRIHAAKGDGTAYIIFNPAAFTHTSVALRDALSAVGVPFIEVHLSNVHAREAFRTHSYFSDIAAGVVSGFGPLSYELALEAVIRSLQATPS